MLTFNNPAQAIGAILVLGVLFYCSFGFGLMLQSMGQINPIANRTIRNRVLFISLIGTIMYLVGLFF